MHLSTTREKALEWWNKLQNGFQTHLMFEYQVEGFTHRNPSNLTGREIEQIWLKEMQYQSEERTAQQHSYKPNQKQFKQFDESLFKAYISKFSNEDKLRAKRILESIIPQDLLIEEELKRLEE